MEKQMVVVRKLTNNESSIVNSKKRNKERYWTHKVVCGEHATFLTIGPRPDLARRVVENWPMVFSGVGNEIHRNAKPVEEADKRYLITLGEKFGDPLERERIELDSKLEQLERELDLSPGELSGRPQKRSRKGFLSKLFGW